MAKEHLANHQVIGLVASSTSFNVTTVGISYDDKSGIIQNVLVGGPAFNSKQVHHGDKIVSIDGAAVQPGDILALLKVLLV